MKKTEFITFRTSAEAKAALEQYASEKKWTISFLVEQIVADWLQDKENDTEKQA